ncbi:MAG: hypothetical protein KGD63_08550 [Candidatus Lokiarchaeota archaeon]|nr:hypothetical protein [Candidatus Lokiarchaeota archaeon]
MKIKNLKKLSFAVIFGLFFLITIVQISSASQDISTSAILPFNDQWLTNSGFNTQNQWNYTLDSDSPLDDLVNSTESGETNMIVIGESFETQIALNSSTYTQWEEFNKTESVILPDDGYGEDQYGLWCSHSWNEGSAGEQPKNTPRMTWRFNVSLPVDMSDYLITSAGLTAEINASVDLNIDTPGDTAGLNQWEVYDYAQFYVEVSNKDVDEISTFKIAFTQTEMLGNDDLSIDEMDEFIETKTEQAIIDALTNVLEADPDHTDFIVIIGIYMYCEDNDSSTDDDNWDMLRFKNLDLYFTYERIIDKASTLSLSQTGASLSGENVTINHAYLRFKYKIDDNWTSNSEFSELRIYINENKFMQSYKLSEYIFGSGYISIVDLDIGSIVTKDVPITLSLKLYIANTFTLDHNITLSIDDVYLRIYWQQVGSETNIFREPWFATLLAVIVTIGLVSLGAGFVYYYRVGRFPIPVRKVRKYRKSLTKDSAPKDVRIIPRSNAFKHEFANKTKVISRDMKDRSFGKKIKQSVLIGEYDKFLKDSS